MAQPFLWVFGVVILVLVLTFNLNFSPMKLFNLLSDGDVENYPGPTYKIIKVIQGSIQQVNLKLGHAAGILLACNSVYALCWFAIKGVAV